MGNEMLVSEALFQTDEELYWKIDGKSTWLSAIKKAGARVKKYRRYERGDQDNNLTDQQRDLLNLKMDAAELNESSANYCSIVVDMMAGRLSVSEVTVDEDDANAWVIETLNRNGFQSKQGEWFRGAIRDREAFVLVDPQTALWSSEPAFDGHSGIVAIYDSMTRLPVWACKLWITSEPADISTDAEDLGEEDVVNVVVYQRDKITYWKGKAGGSTLDKAMVQGGTNITILEEGNGYEWSLGVIPIVQFANKRDNYTSSGESEIRTVIPIQDIINSTLYDMQMASKLSAFKIYYSIGMAMDKSEIVPGSVISMVLQDKDGNTITQLSESMARYLSAVKVGEFGVTDMSQYTSQLDKLEREISQISATPVYGITTSGNLSGEALKQLEVGLINKIHRFQKENVQSIGYLLRITAEIQREFNVNQSFLNRFSEKIRSFLGLGVPTKPPEQLGRISVNWKSAEIVSTEGQVKVLSDMRRDNPGLWSDEWYRERVGSLMGMSSGQIVEEGEKAMEQMARSYEEMLGSGGGNPVI